MMKFVSVICLSVLFVAKCMVVVETLDAKETHDAESHLPISNAGIARALVDLFVEDGSVNENDFGDEEDSVHSLSATSGRMDQSGRAENATIEDSTSVSPTTVVSDSTDRNSDLSATTVPTSTATVTVVAGSNVSESSEKGQRVTDPGIIEQYNKFLDAVYRRANLHLKNSNSDTVYVNFRQAKDRLGKIKAKQDKKKSSLKVTGTSTADQDTKHKFVSSKQKAGSSATTLHTISQAPASDIKVFTIKTAQARKSADNEQSTDIKQSADEAASSDASAREGRGKKNKNKSKQGKSDLVGAFKGVSSFRRAKSVIVKNYLRHKKVLSVFEFGPIELTFFKELKQKRRSIHGRVEKFRGRMVIDLHPDGTAKLTDFKIFHPSSIQVGSDLHRGLGRSFLKKQEKTVSPVAALRLRSIFRSVLTS